MAAQAIDVQSATHLVATFAQGATAAGVFASADDPDYGRLLAGVRAAAGRLENIKRFDMAGFIPRPAYLREMLRYGLLPADHNPASPVDYYALEERYYRTFWYTPAAE